MGTQTISIPSVLGLPPEADSETPSNKLRDSAFPIARITPCTSQATMGATVFVAEPAWEKYNEILQLHGYDYPGTTDFLSVCFQADNFPADNFQNEYSQSFLEKVTSMVSSGVSDMAQMVGDLPKFAGDVTESMKGSGMEGMADMLSEGMNKSANYINNAKNSGSSLSRNIANTMVAMASGGRVDFPMVWKNSSFTPSYSMTIRLYNPNPGNAESTQKYIMGPLAALLILGCPHSPDGTVIKWPFLHRIHIPGIANVSPAFISNVSVIKGGDQQSIGWNQRLGICDVRIDFGSLFNSLIIETDSLDKFGDKRPTLHNYLSGLATERKVASMHMDGGTLSSLMNKVNVSGIVPTQNIGPIRNVVANTVTQATGGGQPWVNPDKIVGNMGSVNPGKWVNPDGVANSPFVNSVRGSNPITSSIPSIGSITNLVRSSIPSIPGIGNIQSMIPNMPNIPSISSLSNMIPSTGNSTADTMVRSIGSNLVKNLTPNVPSIGSMPNLDVQNSLNRVQNTRQLTSPSSIYNDTTNATKSRVNQSLINASNNTNWTAT